MTLVCFLPRFNFLRSSFALLLPIGWTEIAPYAHVKKNISIAGHDENSTELQKFETTRNMCTKKRGLHEGEPKQSDALGFIYNKLWRHSEYVRIQKVKWSKVAAKR